MKLNSLNGPLCGCIAYTNNQLSAEVRGNCMEIVKLMASNVMTHVSMNLVYHDNAPGSPSRLREIVANYCRNYVATS